MANNNFKPFAAAAGANVMAQADYEALAALLTGFQSGTAQSAQLNKVWRQSSIMAAVLGQFIADLTGQDAIDDGTTATLLANLKMAVQAQSAAVVGQARNLKMSVTTASSTAMLNADEIVVGTALGGQKYVLGAFSQTINLATTGAGGMDTGSAPASGYVAIYAIYNPTTGARALIAKDATSAVQPNVYGGANMPAGYIASALVSVWPTNASRQFVVGAQVDREISVANNTVLSTSTTQASLTSFSAAGAIPPNARACRLDLTVGTSLASEGASLVVCGSSIEIGRAAVSATSPSNGATTVVSTPYVSIVTPQTLYYRAAVSGGTLSALVGVPAYTF
ncbi:hypothetical protein LA345_01110 [Burkholderia vietnamiensis]|uniref:Phage tail protein n=1 Tax=Burkholderia vietnamiensis (strain G4 / LMG 22486) TaxID=269482 RepID=A4JMM0_BURVG|nr:hypothetical protein Bcep1808_4560 [Burkholderia vietnamiensis G4]MCB4342531.1 hypothetical protein [Burkholderia vietnamiensis]